MSHSKKKRVFISHSHADREMALKLQRVLEKKGADTFLDQDEIRGGDVLPGRIRNGIDWCNRFLLIWSASASQSNWVGNELDLALARNRKVIPYCLDGTPLPSGIDGLVYVDRSDQEHGHAELLWAVIGKSMTNGVGPFPGQWRAEVNAFGLIGGQYDLELRSNGQIAGSGGIGGGAFGSLLGPQGAIRLPVNGSWAYDDGAQILTLNIVATGFGQSNQDTVRIQTTGQERGPIQGFDFAGRTWTLQRIG